MQFRKRIKHLFQPRALVLMYHRIALLKTDPWQLAVSPQNFEQHLQVLRKKGTLISVKEMISSLHDKRVPDNSTCLTFDDGYTDNFLDAKPLLERYKAPATFFIPTQYTGQGKNFWWDELESIMLRCPALPEKFSLQLTDGLLEFDLGNDSVLTDARLREHELWAWPAPPPTRRCELYLAIWERIRPFPYNALQAVIQAIKLWACYDEPSHKESFPMTRPQLNELSSHPLIDLGLHTVTHPALSCHTTEYQKAEISGNKEALESIYSKPVDTIAYPYGNYNEETLAVVKGLELRAAFTTAEKIVSNLTDPFQIGRFQVRNWNGDDFEKWLLKWKSSARFL